MAPHSSAAAFLLAILTFIQLCPSRVSAGGESYAAAFVAASDVVVSYDYPLPGDPGAIIFTIDALFTHSCVHDPMGDNQIN